LRQIRRIRIHVGVSVLKPFLLLQNSCFCLGRRKESLCCNSRQSAVAKINVRVNIVLGSVHLIVDPLQSISYQLLIDDLHFLNPPFDISHQLSRFLTASFLLELSCRCYTSYSFSTNRFGRLPLSILFIKQRSSSIGTSFPLINSSSLFGSQP
jgi:hypothetical protein